MNELQRGDVVEVVHDAYVMNNNLVPIYRIGIVIWCHGDKAVVHGRHMIAQGYQVLVGTEKLWVGPENMRVI